MNLRPPMTLSLGASDLVELAAEVLAKGGRFRFRVTGTSMQPGLVSGDLVVLATIDPQRLAPGDVVLIRGPRPLLHRVVSIDKSTGQVISRGDAAQVDDPPATLADLVGRVVSSERPWPVRLRRLLGAGRRCLGRVLRRGPLANL
jgi:signal peptidase I